MIKVIFLPPAAKYIKKIKDKNLKKLYQDAVDGLRENPYLGDLKTGDLAGIYSLDIYYNKTNYELAYTVEEYPEETLVIIHAGTRENFYNELKRYMKNK